MIYLDSASTTPISEEVLNEMLPYLTTKYGNPNSVHTLGIESRKAIDQARERVAMAINAEPEQIIFTSGGSEANNMVIHGIKKVFPSIDYISSRTEHTSSVRALESENEPYKSIVLFCDEDNFLKTISEESFYSAQLVWKMFVNNEIGKVNDIYNIGNICRENENVVFGTDCVQAFGFEKIDVQEIGCDFLTISSHKIHGPKGVGALYVRNKDYIKPIINGGVNQEYGLRGGTENVAGIVGFGKACEIATNNLAESRSRILYLRDLLIKKLDGIDFKINCGDESKILSLQFPGIDSETLVLAMSAKNVAISSGSACRNLESKVSDALLSYGMLENEIRSTVRFSFMDTNTENEIENAAEVCKNTIKLITNIKEYY